MKQLEKFYLLLIEWNEKINLTTITEKTDVYLKHFYDSLTLSKVCDFKKIENLCDVGSGAGFPGIVIKIFFPNLKVTLVDSLKKRITFLNIVIKELKLDNIETVNQRAEIHATKNRETYDIVTARAIAKLNILSELCLPMVKINGLFIPMKGQIEEELKMATSGIEKLGGKIIEVEKFLLPIELSERNLIKIVKEKATKNQYPRKFEKIKKNPL